MREYRSCLGRGSVLEDAEYDPVSGSLTQAVADCAACGGDGSVSVFLYPQHRSPGRGEMEARHKIVLGAARKALEQVAVMYDAHPTLINDRAMSAAADLVRELAANLDGGIALAYGEAGR